LRSFDGRTELVLGGPGKSNPQLLGSLYLYRPPKLFPSVDDQAFEVTAKKEAIDEPTEESQGRAEFDHVGHRRPAVGFLEVVIVNERRERPFDHSILKMVGRIEGGDLRGEVLHDAQVARAPSDGLAQADQTACRAGYRALSRMGHRGHMKVDVPRSVEAAGGRGDD
jgi:hypothetical protein